MIGRRVLVGQGRGTRRNDFCRFLRGVVGRQMIKAANDCGLPRDAPLFLMMDNASIHKGVEVSRALRSASVRLHVAYQPPYMPTINPVELVNAQLKKNLQRFHHEQRLIKNRFFGESDVDVELQQKNMNLKELIEKILDTKVSQINVENYYIHCGWRN